MGYRSDVKAVFYTTDPEAWPALKLYVDENFPRDPHLVASEDLRVMRGKGVYGYSFEADGWKWYDSYPEVIAFNRFVSNFLELAHDEEAKLGWHYEFARVGEDYNDIEVNRSDGSTYLLSVVRAIEINF